MLKILLAIIILYIIVCIYLHYKYPESYWDWNNISTDKISFPSKFIWGTATAAHQVEGNCENNWSEFENGLKDDGKPNIKDNQVEIEERSTGKKNLLSPDEAFNFIIDQHKGI